MDSDERPDFSTIKFSNSPRRYTRITQSLGSPVRSVHPEQEAGFSGHMESIDSQADFGHRTADFFDTESSDDETKIPATGLDEGRRERSRSPSKRKQPPPSAQMLASQCEPKRVSAVPDSDGYQRLDSNLNQQIPIESARLSPSTATSFNGSVTELLGEHEENEAPQYPKRARIPSSQTAQSTRRWTMDQEYSQRMSMHSERLDQRLGVHAIAYDFLLRGLLTDEEVMRGSARPNEPLSSRLSGIRQSMLPSALRAIDPRSPKDHLFPNGGMERGPSSITGNGKKVQVVPPPIDTTAPRRSLPEGIVRTPYPFTADRINRKDVVREPPSAMESSMGATESILTLSIKKLNPHSRTRVTTLTIPASNDYSAVRTSTPGADEKYFTAVHFDDAELFSQLRKAYKDLSGPIRLFSARKLTRIAVSGPATRAADAGYGWLAQPRSPRVLAYQGLTDTFSEEKILQHYKKPVLGKSRYAFVHWAHRLAAAPPRTPMPPPSGNEDEDGGQATPSRELVHRIEQPEGLEFVVSWSISRILLALAVVVLLSIAAVLLWTFLGKNTSPSIPVHAGFKGAGDRVGTGILIGIAVFLMGMGCIFGWLGVSWLVM